MEPALARPRHEAIGHDDVLVHQWRVRQPAMAAILPARQPTARTCAAGEPTDATGQSIRSNEQREYRQRITLRHGA